MHNRRLIGAAFVIGLCIGTPTASVAEPTGQVGPVWTQYNGAWYCLVSSDVVLHNHTSHNTLLTETIGKVANQCGANANPAFIRSQLVGWKNEASGTFICFVNPPTAWMQPPNPDSPAVAQSVRTYGLGQTLPCQDGWYNAGGNHEGQYWGGVDTFQQFSGWLKLHRILQPA